MTSSRAIPIATAPNLRGLGGLPVEDGTFRNGEVFRSAELIGLDDQSRAAVAQLGITTVFDLRTAAQQTNAPETLADGIRTIVLDVLADSSDDAAALGSSTELFNDPAVAEQILGDGKAHELMIGSYKDIILLPSALSSYRAFLLELVDPARSGAVLFHCTTGKDRTGWAAALILSLLGASQDTIYGDYLLTNEDLAPATQPVLDHAAAAGVDPDLLRPVLGVDQSYLDTAFATLHATYGSLEGYLSQGLGLDQDVVSALRLRFVG